MLNRRTLIPSLAAAAAALSLPALSLLADTKMPGTYLATFTSRWVMNFEEVRYWLVSITDYEGYQLHLWHTPIGTYNLLVPQNFSWVEECAAIKDMAEWIATNQSV